MSGLSGYPDSPSLVSLVGALERDAGYAQDEQLLGPNPKASLQARRTRRDRPAAAPLGRYLPVRVSPAAVLD